MSTFFQDAPLLFAPGFSRKPQSVPPTPAAPAKTDPEVDEATRRAVEDTRRNRGRASTNPTGALGVQNPAPTTQRVLLGGTA